MESTTPDFAILSIMLSGRTGLEPKAEALSAEQDCVATAVIQVVSRGINKVHHLRAACP
jgi:hypothetical protein